MERDAARGRAERLNAESPDRDRFHWFARERDGAWDVVRIPGATRAKPTGAAQPPSSPYPHQDQPGNLPGGLPPGSVGG